MEIRDARLLFDAGALSKCLVIPSTLGEGFEVVVFKKELGDRGGLSISTKRGGTRQFKTVDAALKIAGEIGFSSVEIRLQ